MYRMFSRWLSPAWCLPPTCNEVTELINTSKIFERQNFVVYYSTINAITTLAPHSATNLITPVGLYFGFEKLCMMQQ